ncbi:Synaptotagmin-14 [Schistosoma japonicum]|nr:Synaptotagmin-14 [Schistosoma japonicum]
MGISLSSSDDLSYSTVENDKRKISTSSKAGKPKLLSIQEYEVELNRLTNEPISMNDTDTDEYLSGLESDDEDNEDTENSDIRSFTLPDSSRLQLSVHYDDLQQEMNIKIIRVNNVPGREAGGAQAYQICLSMEPDNKHYWQSKLRTAPNPEYLEEWKFNIPLITIHKSTLICRIIGYIESEREYVYGEAAVPFENLNLNIENVLTVNFQPIPVSYEFQSIKTDNELDDECRTGTIQDRLSICSQNKNEMISNTQMSTILITLRLNQNTGRLECCIQQINLIGVRISRLPKRCIYVKLFLRTEQDGLIDHARSAYHQKQSIIHVNETFAFSIKQYQIPQITVEFSLIKRKTLKKRITIGTCKIGKYNTSIDELDHWKRVLSTNNENITKWHKFYSLAITPLEMTIETDK